MRPWLRPLYHGITTVRTGAGLQDYLVLEHVGCSNPSACDIKMGFAARLGCRIVSERVRKGPKGSRTS